MLLLMCEYLMRCPIQSGRDVAVGSFLCSMVLVVCSVTLNLVPSSSYMNDEELLAEFLTRHEFPFFSSSSSA